MARRRRNRIEEEAKALRKQRREMLRERKMAVERRKLMSALVPVLVLVFGFVAFGWFRLAWWQPRQPVARVAGTAITAQDYGKRVQFARRQTLNNLSSLLGFLQSTDPSFIQSYVQGQRTGVAQQTLDQMIDERLIREDAEARGITVTDEEIEERICGELSQATGATTASTDADEEDAEAEDGEDAAAEEETSDEAESEADAEAADDEGEAEDSSEADDAEESDEAAGDDGEDVAAPSDEFVCALEGPELDRAFETVLEPQLDQAGMSRRDYEELVRAQLYRDKLSESLGDELDTTAEQTEIEYLLFTDESVAADANAALESGESWAAVSARFERPEEPAVEDEAEGDAETDAAESDEVDEADAEAESDVDEAADDAAVDDEAEGDEADEAEATDDEGADTSDDTDADAEASDEGDEADTEASDEAEDEAAADDEAEGDESDEAADEDGDEDEATEDESEGDEADEDASDEDAAAEDSEAAEDDSAADEDGDDTSDEAEEEPEQAPTPEPDPYAFDISERQWFTAEQLQTRLGLTETEVEEIFGLDAGSHTEALQGSQGFYILHVLDKDADREIDEGELQRLKDSAMEEWLTETRLSKSSEINRFPTDGLIPEEPDWFVQGFDQLTSSLGGQAPLDLGGLDTSGGTSP